MSTGVRKRVTLAPEHCASRLEYGEETHWLTMPGQVEPMTSTEHLRFWAWSGPGRALYRQLSPDT
jgi:hypothetical protein